MDRSHHVVILSTCFFIKELALDGNPFTAEASYKQIVIDQMQCLRQLDLKKVTDDERRMASIVVRKEQEKKKECSKVNKSYLNARLCHILPTSNSTVVLQTTAEFQMLNQYIKLMLVILLFKQSSVCMLHGTKHFSSLFPRYLSI